MVKGACEGEGIREGIHEGNREGNREGGGVPASDKGHVSQFSSNLVPVGIS